MSKKQKTALCVTREENYSEWYQEVIKVAELAENSPARGCMTLRPWGCALWENIQKILDDKIKETGHENVYFPLFIPLSFLSKEAEHVEGFAKECAVVTHHRLEMKEGKLVPGGPLEEPLVVRPTSEAIMGDAFSRWVKSYRDLPILINQWANVVRWEMRPRIFLRTTEILWQEGHTVHATEEEAMDETKKMAEVYRHFCENYLAVPVILGAKTSLERFPGADITYTCEMMMQDRKALQGGTAHYLGQHFSKAFNIQFLDQDHALKYAYTTSWGITTRLIGALIMTHADDDGLKLPPKIAPKQVAIIPFITDEANRGVILAYAHQLKQKLEQKLYCSQPLRVIVDERHLRGGEKNWSWIKKGVPLRIEVGIKEVENRAVPVYSRAQPLQDKVMVEENILGDKVVQMLEKMHETYYEEAYSRLKSHTHTHFTSIEELKKFFTPQNPTKPEIHGGFAEVFWGMDPVEEKKLHEWGVSIRCVTKGEEGLSGVCIATGKPTAQRVIIAKAY